MSQTSKENLPVDVNIEILVKETRPEQLFHRILTQVTDIFRSCSQFDFQLKESHGYQLMYWYGIAMMCEFSPTTYFVCASTGKKLCQVSYMVNGLLNRYNQVKRQSDKSALKMLQKLGLATPYENQHTLVNRVTLPGALNALMTKTCKCHLKLVQKKHQCVSTAKIWTIRDKLWYWACKQFALVQNPPSVPRTSHMVLGFCTNQNCSVCKQLIRSYVVHDNNNMTKACESAVDSEVDSELPLVKATSPFKKAAPLERALPLEKVAPLKLVKKEPEPKPKDDVTIPTMEETTRNSSFFQTRRINGKPVFSFSIFHDPARAAFRGLRFISFLARRASLLF